MGRAICPEYHNAVVEEKDQRIEKLKERAHNLKYGVLAKYEWYESLVVALLESKGCKNGQCPAEDTPTPCELEELCSAFYGMRTAFEEDDRLSQVEADDTSA